MHKKSAFTLIELIVVLVVLLAIYFFISISHTHRYSRENARNILCQTNLKGYGNAYIMYLDDYDLTFPDARTWLFRDPNTPSSSCLWHDKLHNLENNPDNIGTFFKYVADKNNYVCPTFDKLAQSGLGQYHPGHNPEIPMDPQYSYSLNAYLGSGPHGLIKKLGDLEANPGRVATFTEQNIMWNIQKRSRYNPDLNPFMFLPRTAPYQPEDFNHAFATYHFAPSEDIEIGDTDDSYALQDGADYPQWGLTRGSGNAVFLDQHVQALPFWTDAHEYAYPRKNPIPRPTTWWLNLKEYYEKQ